MSHAQEYVSPERLWPRSRCCRRLADSRAGRNASGRVALVGRRLDLQTLFAARSDHPRQRQEPRVVWRRPALDPELKEQFPKLRTNNYLRATPTMIGGVLYAPDATGLVQAFDAATGQPIWRQEPAPDMADEASASSTRGVDFWKGGSDHRLFNVRNGYLYALDLRGRAIGAFGDRRPREPGAGGRSQLRLELRSDRRRRRRRHRRQSGRRRRRRSEVEEQPARRRARLRRAQRQAAVDVSRRAARRRVRRGHAGATTRGTLSGDLGSWCCISADEQLGYVYIPLTAPTAAYYGGFRPGDNLFSNALVALDAKTGKRVWHFQMVHHDLWEYDTVGPATLGDITVDGRRIKAVMQPSKTGFLYVFDRVTGTAGVADRRAAGAAIDGPGRAHRARRSRFPTKPRAVRAQRPDRRRSDRLHAGAARAGARAREDSSCIGPIFTPPSLVSDATGR